MDKLDLREKILGGVFGIISIVSALAELMLGDMSASGIFGAVKDISGTLIVVILLVMVVKMLRPQKKSNFREIFDAAMPYDIEVMGVMDATIYDYIPYSLMELKAQYRKENDIADDVPWTAGTFKMIVDQRRGYSSINYIKTPDEIPNPVNKICLAHTAEYLAKPYEELLEKLGDKYHFARTSPQWIECAPQGINKGAAILRLAERLGITPDQIAVFGDGENDLSMFRVVKYPIAMGNAMDTA